MRHIRSAAVFAAVFIACAAAHAQVSLLRVTCEGDDVGAEVTLNGKFRGECPLDIQAGTGTVKLRVVKKVDATHERVFEREYRMGDGGMQRAEALLGPAQPSAEGLRIEAGRLAAERVQAASRKQVRDAALAAGLIPPRPQMPLEVSEDIWQIIEASEAYRKLPRSRSVKVGSLASEDREYTGSKTAALPKPAVTSVGMAREIVPLGDRCSVNRRTHTTDGKPVFFEFGIYACGSFISLGSTVDGKPGGLISSLDELKGSLFPMRIGNRLSVRSQMAYLPDRKFDSTENSSCGVESQGPAGAVDPRLNGVAWKLRCRHSSTAKHDNKITTSEFDDYYLEELGVLLSDIGLLDSQKKAIVLPSPGSTTLHVAEGEYGSRATRTYSLYHWTVGK